MVTTPTIPASPAIITDNILRVRAQISEAAARSGRLARDIRLIAVSKTQPLAAVQAALSANQEDFGENTIQDARNKIDHLQNKTAVWHFIGHLQNNKAKYLPGRFQWLHTLDSLELAKKINQSMSSANQSLSTLIQVNVSNDPDKYGVDKNDLPELIETILNEDLKQIQLKGLMTIGKLGASQSEQKTAFDLLRELRNKMAESFELPLFTELSMGMSGDYLLAIESGSTMVRVGSSIFGARNKRTN